MNEWTKADELAADIDLRLMWLWQTISATLESDEVVTLAEIASWVRVAYGQGYVDALSEPRGKLCIDHGYRIPTPVDE